MRGKLSSTEMLKCAEIEMRLSQFHPLTTIFCFLNSKSIIHVI